MGERYRLLGGYRGGSDMRLGSLVRHIEHEFFAIVIDEHGDGYGLNFHVIRIDNTISNWYSECELEVICE